MGNIESPAAGGSRREPNAAGRGPGSPPRNGRLPALGLGLFIGFTGILFICYFTHWYETVLWHQREEQQLTSTVLAPLVLFMVFALLLGLNPLLHRFAPWLKLARREFIVIISMWLITAVISYTSFANPLLLDVGAFMSPNIKYGLMDPVGYKSYLPQNLYLRSEDAQQFFYGIGTGTDHVLPFAPKPELKPDEILDVKGLVAEMEGGKSGLAKNVLSRLAPKARELLSGYLPVAEAESASLATELNQIISGPPLYSETLFKGVTIAEETRSQAARAPQGETLAVLNRKLLVEALPGLIAKRAEGGPVALQSSDILSVAGLARTLESAKLPLTRHLQRSLSEPARESLTRFVSLSNQVENSLVAALNTLIDGPSFYAPGLFAEGPVGGDAQKLINRLILNQSFPDDLVAPPMPNPWDFIEPEIKDPARFAKKLTEARDPASRFVLDRMTPADRKLIESYLSGSPVPLTTPAGPPPPTQATATPTTLAGALADGLSKTLRSDLLLGNPTFASITISPKDQRLVNRMLLQHGFTGKIGPVRASVPWAVWLKPLAYWIPFMLVAVILSSVLVQMVHRQWSRHELLAFPIADVTNVVISQDTKRAFPDVFYSRGFWVGFAITAFVFTLNDLQKWFPLVPGVKLGYWYSNLVREFPFLAKYCCEYAFSLFRLLIHPYVIALVVLLPLDVSLTCWLGWILMILFTGVNFMFTGDPFPDTGSGQLRAGTYVAVFFVILAVGWREYVRIAWLAFTFHKTGDRELRDAAWACRVFVLAFAALVGLLVYAGMDWLMAVLFGCSFVLILVVIARVTAEIGIPWLYNMLGSARYLPMSALGPAAVGPRSLVVMSLIAGMLDLNPSTSIAANETVYRKLEETEKTGLPHWRFNAILLLAAVVAVGATIFSQVWNDYSYGAKRETLMAWVPIRDCGLATSENLNRLQMEGNADKLDKLSGFQKLGQIKAEPKFWRYFMYGFVAVSVCAFMRLRFAWWPLHPLPWLFFNSWVMSRIFFSIFLGWFIKLCLVKIGGGRVFSQSRPFWVGVIMGQIVVSVIFIFVVVAYCLITGLPPPPDAYITWY